MHSYLGIDFGTSNTHVAYCNDQDDGKLIPVPIRLGRESSTTTCVLWRGSQKDDGVVVACGTIAEETWNQFEANERHDHSFAFGFKPDLVRSEEARVNARAFLRRVCQEVSQVHQMVVTHGTVVIGVPAGIGEEHVQRTAEAAHAAGFVNVQCVEEPLEALSYHLNEGQMTLSDARHGVVVVDFGGGTFYVALVDADGLRRPWGEPVLGGRLFDDVFFQWVRDQNSFLEVDEREAMVVWQRECRELKEKFSQHWGEKGDEMNDFRDRVEIGDNRKWLKNASVAEFLVRARNYSPSELAVRYFKGLTPPPERLVNANKPIDLLDWIRGTMLRATSGNGIGEGIAKVILTGGSSHWPFMWGLAEEVFGAGRVLKSNDPETTIGSGLALYTAIRSRNQERRGRLPGDQAKARDRFAKAVARRLDKFADDAANAIVAAIMPKIEQVFWNWYRNGGSLAAVENRVKVICKDFEPQVSRLLEGQWQALDADLVRLVRDHLEQFLLEHEISKDVSRYIPDSVTLKGIAGGAGQTSDKIAEDLGDLAGAVAAMASSVAAVVVAAIKIKLVLLVAILHPIMALLVGTGALLAVLGLGEYVKEQTENLIKQHEFNWGTRNIMYLGLWESRFKEKLQAGRQSALTDIRREVRLSLDGAKDEKGNKIELQQKAISTFDGIVTRVIDELGVLEHIRAAG